jgi:hypothetical protein
MASNSAFTAEFMPMRVAMQDFNEPVLRLCTAPNVAKNCEQNQLEPACSARYISGDFESACAMLAASNGFVPFDVIITSESVYNDASAHQIVQGCDKCLSQQGCVYVASKSHYFGVGGGLVKFKGLIDGDGRFSWCLVRRWDDGQSNIREVLRLVRGTHVVNS